MTRRRRDKKLLPREGRAWPIDRSQKRTKRARPGVCALPHLANELRGSGGGPARGRRWRRPPKHEVQTRHCQRTSKSAAWHATSHAARGHAGARVLRAVPARCVGACRERPQAARTHAERARATRLSDVGGEPGNDQALLLHPNGCEGTRWRAVAAALIMRRGRLCVVCLAESHALLCGAAEEALTGALRRHAPLPLRARRLT